MLGEGRASVAHLNHPYGMGAKWYRLAELRLYCMWRMVVGLL